ncbi:MAG: glycosyltransferase family 2 protein [Verrucomicrobiota bacterium]
MGDPEASPLVSIVVATYRRQDLVVRAVRSALAQTHPRVEVVVSDDASPDGTWDALRAVAAGEARLQVSRQPANAGVWANWTEVVRRARGEYLVFLGDDDVLDPEFAARHLEVFRRLPGTVAVFSAHEERTPAGGFLRGFRPPFGDDRQATPDEFFEAIARWDLFFGAAMFRREEAARVWEMTRPDGIVADVGLMYRLALSEKAPVAGCPHVGYLKTTHPVQLSSAHVSVTGLLRDLMARLAPLAEVPAHRRRLLRLAALEGVTLGRHHAAEDRMPEARREFRRAMGTSPGCLAAWTQWVQSLLLPGRVRRTSRAQRPSAPR